MHPPDPDLVRRLVREAVDRAWGGAPAPAPAAPAAAPVPPAASPAATVRRVAIAADHGGVALKAVLVRAIRDELGWEVADLGTHGGEAVDYPDFAAAVGREVAAGRALRGIVLDAAGIGSTMAANKVPGVRCALCHDDATVLNSRLHNDANVLALGARVVHRGAAVRLVRLFLTTAFEGGRHERRVAKIMALESAPRGA
jgi:ribose 5-phosphate isomerase B